MLFDFIKYFPLKISICDPYYRKKFVDSQFIDADRTKTVHFPVLIDFFRVDKKKLIGFSGGAKKTSRHW